MHVGEGRGGKAVAGRIAYIVSALLFMWLADGLQRSMTTTEWDPIIICSSSQLHEEVSNSLSCVYGIYCFRRASTRSLTE